MRSELVIRVVQDGYKLWNPWQFAKECPRSSSQSSMWRWQALFAFYFQYVVFLSTAECILQLMCSINFNSSLGQVQRLRVHKFSSRTLAALNSSPIEVLLKVNKLSNSVWNVFRYYELVFSQPEWKSNLNINSERDGCKELDLLRTTLLLLDTEYLHQSVFNGHIEL